MRLFTRSGVIIMKKTKKYINVLWDYRYNKIGFVFLLLIMLGFFYILVSGKSVITVQAEDQYRLKSNMFLLSDFLIPVLFSIWLIVVFSKDLNKKTLPYINSLPLSVDVFVLTRFLIHLFLFSCCYVLLMGLFAENFIIGHLGNTFLTNFSEKQMIGISYVNVMFLASFALFSMALFQNSAISCMILLGFVFFDFFSQSDILNEYSLFVNIFKLSMDISVIKHTRLVYAVISFILIVFSWLLLKINIFKNKYRIGSVLVKEHFSSAKESKGT